MIRGVIFDLGSTLLRGEHRPQWAANLLRLRGDVLAHLQAAGYHLDAADFEARFSAKVREFADQQQTDWVPATTEWIVTSTLAELRATPPTAEAQAAAVAFALARYNAYSEALWQPAPGALAVLAELHSRALRLGAISNSSDAAAAHNLVDAAGLRRWLDPVIVAGAAGLRKPNPRLFALVVEAWGLPPSACVMVGAMLGADILGAQLAGLHNVWLTTQADHPANRAHAGQIVPEAQIDRLDQLPALVFDG